MPNAAGRRLNYTPQLYYYKGPFGLMLEYAVSAQKVSAVVSGGTLVHNFSNNAWQVAASYVLTGEKKSFGSVVPGRGLESRMVKGLGAWEVVGRYTGLNVDPSVFADGFAEGTKSAGAARAWTVGLNWYLNYFSRVEFNYEQTQFQGGNLIGNRPTEKILEEHLQVAF